MGRPRKTLRKGRLSQAEKSALQAAAQSDLPVEKAAEALSPVLGRTEESLKRAIQTAREALVAAAPSYVELHQKAAKKAAGRGDARPAQWALENLSLGGERVVEPAEKQAGPGLSVNILLSTPLGGTKPAIAVKSKPQSELEEPSIEGLLVEATDTATQKS